MNVRPSEKFTLLVERVHGSVNAAADKWGIHPTILYRFMSKKDAGGMTLDTAAQISHKSGVSLDELFVIEPEPEKASKR